MNKKILGGAFLLLFAVGFTTLPVAQFFAPAITVPAGFTITKVADSLGKVRHIDVNSSGGIYVRLNALKDGKGTLYLTDQDKDGVMDAKTAFGNFPGTGITIKGKYLYSSSNTGVFRYPLNKAGEVIDTENPELIVDGLMDKKRDNSKSITLDNNNNLYVTIGSYSDACREGTTGKGIPGCPILDSAAGIWMFKANKTNQSFKDGLRYATGLKNSVGIDWNSAINFEQFNRVGETHFNKLLPCLAIPFPSQRASQQGAGFLQTIQGFIG